MGVHNCAHVSYAARGKSTVELLSADTATRTISNKPIEHVTRDTTVQLFHKLLNIIQKQLFFISIMVIVRSLQNVSLLLVLINKNITWKIIYYFSL